MGTRAFEQLGYDSVLDKVGALGKKVSWFTIL